MGGFVWPGFPATETPSPGKEKRKKKKRKRKEKEKGKEKKRKRKEKEKKRKRKENVVSDRDLKDYLNTIDDDTDFTQRIACGFCNGTYKTPHSLWQHLSRDHTCNYRILFTSGLYNRKVGDNQDKRHKLEQERRHATETLGTEEGDTLSKYTVKANTHVYCDKCKLRILKRSVFKHVTLQKGKHRLDKKVAAGWASVKDGSKIKHKHNNRDLHCSFERLTTKIAPDDDDYDENGVPVNAVAPVQAQVQAPAGAQVQAPAVEAQVQAPVASSCGHIDFYTAYGCDGQEYGGIGKCNPPDRIRRRWLWRWWWGCTGPRSSSCGYRRRS